MGYGESDAERVILAGRPQSNLVYRDDAEAALRELDQAAPVKENDVA